MFEIARKTFRLSRDIIDFEEKWIFASVGKELLIHGFKLKYDGGNKFDGNRTKRIYAKHEFATLELFVDLIPYSKNYLYVGFFSLSTALAELQRRDKTAVNFFSEISAVVSKRLIELGMEEIEL